MATVIKGTAVAKKLRQGLKADILEIRKEQPEFTPGLTVVQVGDRPDSNVYIGAKVKACAEIGIHGVHLKLPPTTTQQELIDNIERLNQDPTVHGIILQVPLDCNTGIDETLCTNVLSPSKDVDGLTDVNAGRLSRGDLKRCFTPCTPTGCMVLIEEAGVDVKGKNVCVVGRSKIVGAPMHDLLLWAHGTVTTCHSRTPDLRYHINQADVVVVAAGKKELVKGEWIKPGAVVIDCGINPEPDATKKSGVKLWGDVEYPVAKQVAGAITPVPGGVGPMTVALLMRNTVTSAKRMHGVTSVGGQRSYSTASFPASHLGGAARGYSTSAQLARTGLRLIQMLKK